MPKLFGASLFLGLQIHLQSFTFTHLLQEQHTYFPFVKGKSNGSHRPQTQMYLFKLAALSIKESVVSSPGARPNYS